MKSFLDKTQTDNLLATLRKRFEKNTHRHIGLSWSEVEVKLLARPEKLWSLNEMEITEGEPDVVKFDSDKGEFYFFDCSKESPKGRRSVCYDPQALESRKEFKPKHSALGMAQEMGVKVLSEQEYFYLQSLETVDTKTSSWLLTEADLRGKGGAIFGDWRYGRTFIYHNGAESYYAARGFRACVIV